MALIRKIKAENQRVIYFAGLKMFSYKRKGDHYLAHESEVFLELKKYLPHHTMQPFPENGLHQNTIWQLWLQGESARPPIVKICMESVHKHTGGAVITLTEENLGEFVQLPDFIKDKYNQGIISKAHLSDYIRLMLLAQYGGTWIDATCMLTDEIPALITDSDYFMFKDRHWMNMNRVPDSAFFDLIQPSYGPCFHPGSNWFIHAKANCPIVLDMLAMLNAYWRENNHLVDYFLFHYMLTHAIITSPQNRAIYDKMPAYSNIPPHLLQHNLFKPFAATSFEGLLQNSFIHKLTYKGLDNCPRGDTFLRHLLETDAC